MHKTFIYTETAFHHEGDVNFLYRLIDESAEARIDGVKFQVLINLNELISKQNPAYEKLQSYVFSESQWSEIFRYTAGKGLSVIAMPLDIASCSLLASFSKDIRYVELHSVSYYDNDVKKRIKELGIDLILGTGGRTKNEIQDAFHYFGTQLKVLMTGFQAFPSRIEDIRLLKIQELKKEFPSALIGYADHSGFDDRWAIDSNLVAFCLGATIFEKHITINEGEKRVDYESAVGKEKIKTIKTVLDELHSILFEYKDPFEMTQPEQNYRNRQKMAVAAKDLKAGHVLKADDLVLKMTGDFTGFPIKDSLIGKTLVNDIHSDVTIKQQDVHG